VKKTDVVRVVLEFTDVEKGCEFIEEATRTGGFIRWSPELAAYAYVNLVDVYQAVSLRKE